MKDFEESNRVYKENYRTSRNFEALDEQENFYYDVLEMLERG